MIAISSIEDIEKNIRTILIQQSGLPGEFVRNALSIYGTDLDEVLHDNIYTSFRNRDSLWNKSKWDVGLWNCLRTALLLFELQTRESDADMDEDEGSYMSYYRSFKIYLIMYGEYSSILAHNLSARLRSQQARDWLHNKGIHIEEVTNPVRLNEYINEVMWIRNDIEIDIRCKFNVPYIIESYYYNQTNKMKVEEAM